MIPAGLTSRLLGFLKEKRENVWMSRYFVLLFPWLIHQNIFFLFSNQESYEFSSNNFSFIIILLGSSREDQKKENDHVIVIENVFFPSLDNGALDYYKMKKLKENSNSRADCWHHNKEEKTMPTI